MTFDEDLANTFLTGADWDDNAYSSNVKTYQSAFYTGSGHDEENLQKYLELANEISGGSVYGDAYSPRQQRSMRAALDKAWTDSTGLRAPTDDDIAAWSDIEQTAKAEGKKTNSLSAFLFGDKEKKEEKKKAHESETTETQNPVQIGDRSDVKRVSLTASTAPGIVFSEEEKQDEPKQTEEKQWFGKQYEEEQAEVVAPTVQRESVSTPGEAMTLYLKGEPLTAEENEMLTPYLESNAGRMLLNRRGAVSSLDTVSSSLQKEAKALNMPETIPSTIGSTLEGVVDVLRNGMLDDETAGMGYLALIQVMQDADAWIESGAVSIPAGKTHTTSISARMTKQILLCRASRTRRERRSGDSKTKSMRRSRRRRS